MKHPVRKLVPAAAICLSLIAGGAAAQNVELQQTGFLHSGSYIDNFYIGGYAGNTYTSGALTGNLQYGPGPNEGFTFSSNATTQSIGTSFGKFENLPSGDPDHNTQILSFSGLGLGTTTDTINFIGGFSNVTFNYALGANNAAFAQTAKVWSGLNGTGTVVGTIALTASANPIACATRLDAYCSWSAASGSGFSDIGQSITFGVANTAASQNLELDAITVSPVPEPSQSGMMLAGLALLGLFGFVRRRGN
ncbi:hypothetical protein AAKU67_002500 [Oxalobacteraceae bacterium GrIS 2.11]